MTRYTILHWTEIRIFLTTCKQKYLYDNNDNFIQFCSYFSLEVPSMKILNTSMKPMMTQNTIRIQAKLQSKIFRMRAVDHLIQCKYSFRYTFSIVSIRHKKTLLVKPISNYGSIRIRQ